ncbi:MAG: dihydropteroate synthase [Aggregatilineales bacterium]
MIYQTPVLNLSTTSFEWGRQTYIMGIVNVTPDSFSGDGLWTGETNFVAAAVDQARKQVIAGADIIDVGGESTRPGSQTVSVAEELDRVIPVIRALAAEISLPISIDTYKAEVAEQALGAGATVVNDVWGLRTDPDMVKVVARSEAAVVITHNRNKPKNVAQEARLGGRYVGIEYQNLMADIAQELGESVALALQAGIAPGNIILDPGFGFGKTVEQNLQLLDQLDKLKAIGYPLLVGLSRKSFIGHVLDLPPDQRLEGTAAAVTLAIARGTDIIRVHDVAVMSRVARLTDAVVRRHGKPTGQ